MARLCTSYIVQAVAVQQQAGRQAGRQAEAGRQAGRQTAGRQQALGSRK